MQHRAHEVAEAQRAVLAHVAQDEDAHHRRVEGESWGGNRIRVWEWEAVGYNYSYHEQMVGIENNQNVVSNFFVKAMSIIKYHATIINKSISEECI